MQHSPYATAIPALLAQMREERDETPAPQPDQDGEEPQKVYVYRTEDGGLYFSQILVEDQEPKPPIIDSTPPEDRSANPPVLTALIFSVVALFAIILISLPASYQEPVVHETLRVQAILLPLKTFQTAVAIIPTGIKTYPATTAHGILTITNGSILSEELPKGLILTGKEGVEVITDKAVFVPAGSATGYGVAYVSAHAATSGKSGNIPPLDVDSVEGTSLYIRNLAAFIGGKNAYTTSFITPTDRATAISAARARLTAQRSTGILLNPCIETITGEKALSVAWTCQFVTYHLPAYMKVTKIQVVGKSLLVDVIFVERPRILIVK